MKRLAVLITLLGLTASAQTPIPPALPSAGYNTQGQIGEPTDFTGYTPVAVGNVGHTGAQNATDLQNAVNAAACDTVISLAAGANFESTTHTTLPAKSCPAGQWVVLMSNASAANLPAAGVRTGPSYAAYLPVITIGSAGNDGIDISPSANDYLIENVEVTLDTSTLVGQDLSYSLVNIGDGTYGAGCIQCNPTQEPTNIILDRVLLRGSDSPPIGFRRGVSMNCSRCAVINSYIGQIHETGNDSQAIGAWNTTGPWLIDNNFLSASGENILLGGADSNMGENPTDIVFTHNYVYKPESWNPSDPSYAGTHWMVKNSIEFKVGVRVLIEGNYVQNCWSDAQSGRAIAIQTAASSNNNWSQDADFTIAYNRVDNAQGIASITGFTSGITGGIPTARVSMHDNLATTNGPGAGFYFLSGGDDTDGIYGAASDVLANHNTILQDTSNPTEPIDMLAFESNVATGETPMPRFAFDNNIVAYPGRYTITANCSVNSTSVPCYTDTAWLNNLVFNTSGSSPDVGNLCDTGQVWTIYAVHAVACPVADQSAVGFVDAVGGNYALSASSPGYKKATDGTDVGANIPLLNQALDPTQSLPCPTGGSNVTLLAFSSSKILNFSGKLGGIGGCSWQ